MSRLCGAAWVAHGDSATLLARKWERARLVNVHNNTLRRIHDNPEAMAAVERIEGFGGNKNPRRSGAFCSKVIRRRDWNFFGSARVELRIQPID